MKVLLIYHYFYPDGVVSSRIFSGLAEKLAAENDFEVYAYSGNRAFRGEEVYNENGALGNVRIRRFSRPGLNQGNHVCRLINSAVLQMKWLWALRKEKFDVIILGTDPQFSFMMFPFMRLLQKKAKLIHWAFDIYPDAITASGGFAGKLARLSIPFTHWALKYADAIWDLGPCMRKLLQKYSPAVPYRTFTPWALVENSSIPEADAATRRELFGDAKIGILYSGTVGYAHDIAPFIALARKCRAAGLPVAFCFAGSGNTYKEQTAGITAEDTNIRLAGFADEKELGKRLAAADIHMISLREKFSGVVVPSKFFGALAAGRMVLFSGDRESGIARWVEKYNCGWHLDENTFSRLAELASSDEAVLEKCKARAFEAYKNDFSRQSVISRISAELRNSSSQSRP